MQEFQLCFLCQKPCLKINCLRMYEMNRNKASHLRWICSSACARQDEKFSSRVFYYFDRKSIQQDH